MYSRVKDAMNFSEGISGLKRTFTDHSSFDLSTKAGSILLLMGALSVLGIFGTGGFTAIATGLFLAHLPEFVRGTSPSLLTLAFDEVLPFAGSAIRHDFGRGVLLLILGFVNFSGYYIWPACLLFVSAAKELSVLHAYFTGATSAPRDSGSPAPRRF